MGACRSLSRSPPSHTPAPVRVASKMRSDGRNKEVQRVRDLPDECWALVLSRLKSQEDRDAAALTCRRWRSLEALSRHSLRFLVWHNVPKDQWPRIHLFLLQALHTFPNVLSLTIHGDLSDLPYSFPRVFQHKGFAHLTFFDLSISQDHVTDHLLQCLALGCPSLLHLSLCTSNITDAGMLSLAHGCPLLRSLDMSCCGITDKGIDVLFSKCLDMREFSVEECDDIKGWGFRHGKHLEKLKAIECRITNAGLVQILQGSKSLQTLNLSHNVGQPELSLIGECCKELRVLELMWSSTLDDVALEMIAEGCKNLRVLDVSWCHYVTFDGWEALASCKKLKQLAVTGCEGFDPDCLLPIQKGCPNLCILKVSDHFALHPSLSHFRVSRPAVEVKFYDGDNLLV